MHRLKILFWNGQSSRVYILFGQQEPRQFFESENFHRIRIINISEGEILILIIQGLHCQRSLFSRFLSRLFTFPFFLPISPDTRLPVLCLFSFLKDVGNLSFNLKRVEILIRTRAKRSDIMYIMNGASLPTPSKNVIILLT